MIRSIEGYLTYTRPLASGLLLVALAGCASGPSEKDLLPDEGPTTLEVYDRHMAGASPGGDNPPQKGQKGKGTVSSAPSAPSTSSAFPPVILHGAPIAPNSDSETRSGREALTDLQRDFQRLPNPEILGYVYPHLSGDLPVPGYYTVFPLREGMQYAEPGEGFYPGAPP